MIRGVSVQPREHRMAPAGRRVLVETQIRVLHRPVDAAAERHAEHIGKSEVVASSSRLVIERRSECRQERAAARHERADGVALGV